MKTQALTAILAIFLLTAGAAFGAGMSAGPGSVDFSAGGPGVLTVSGPEGFEYRAYLETGSGSMSLFNAEGQHLADGPYTWQIVLDGKAPEKRSGKPVLGESYSGTFTIAGGAVANPLALEGDLEKAQTFTTDLIVQGSGCIGFDCSSSESFGFDTLRLKENNLRIHFDDTSSSASFPSNDWRLQANDSSNGGANYFSIEDATSGKTPFKVEAGAIANALYVDAAGDVGVGTATPVVEVHAVDGNTPTLRLEQDGSSGFTPQTWDLAGNETNFFIRDVTNGSKLPFRIKPGAPDNSIFITDNGDVGLGTDSPKTSLHVLDGGSAFNALEGTNALFQNNGETTDNVFVSLMSGSAGNSQLSFGDSSSQFASTIIHQPNTGELDIRAAGAAVFRTGNTDRVQITNGGTNMIETTAGGSFGNGALLTSAGVWQSVSRRSAKTNIAPLSAEAAMQAFSELEPVTYNYKVEPDELTVGFIADDVPELVATASHQHLAPLDLIGLLTKVVQEQQKMIQDLNARMAEVE